MYTRAVYNTIVARLEEPRRFIQVLAGPRQVGKTTLAQQVITAKPWQVHYASADEPTLRDRTWLEQQWDLARLKLKSGVSPFGTLLFLDEIQKIPDWSEVVKRLWDEDTRTNQQLKVILLGSSPLLLQQGLTESLTGRFETIAITHWSFAEMQQAFGWNLEQYLYFGGYPGAAPLIADEERWTSYVCGSLIETSLSRDVLLLTNIKKPALLRQLFQLSCDYSGQILSYQKLLGQLDDAGNTTTLAHYLKLLGNVGMVTGLQKFFKKPLKQKLSSPKLQVYNTALISAQANTSFAAALAQRDFWGRLVESAVGAYLLNSAINKNIAIYYWRERNREVDFVVQNGSRLIGIEVKSGAKSMVLPGMGAFKAAFSPQRVLLVGGDGMPLQEFLQYPITEL